MIRDYVVLARPFTLLTPAIGVAVGGLAAIANHRAIVAAREAASSSARTVASENPDSSPITKVANEVAGAFASAADSISKNVNSAIDSVSGKTQAAAVAEQSAVNPWMAIVAAAIAAMLLNASSNALNQICDLKIDRVAKPKRPIPSGAITVRAAWVFTLLTAVAALALAIGASQYPATTAVIFGAAALLTWAYSSPPVRLRRFGWWANLTIAIPRGLLLAAAGWSVVYPLDAPDPWVIGAFPALFLIGAATTKDFADMEADRADGVRTLPVVLGPERATKVMVPFLIAPFLSLAGFGIAKIAGLYDASGAVPESTRRLVTPEWLDGTFAAANGWVLTLLGFALAGWGWHISRLLRRDPHALTTTENHPSWRHMYLLMLTYYGGVAAAYSLA